MHPCYPPIKMFENHECQSLKTICCKILLTTVLYAIYATE